jgi:acyl-coenzyme A thioesterase PaaI-like protein
MRDKLQELLDSQPRPVCAALTPFKVVAADLDLGSVKLEFTAQPAFGNHFGNVQGGFAVAMIDVLLSVCAYARYRLWLPTAEIKTSFVEPLPIADCLGEASVVKAGRSLAFLEARLLTADGRPAVTASATAVVPQARR